MEVGVGSMIGIIGFERLRVSNLELRLNWRRAEADSKERSRGWCLRCCCFGIGQHAG